MVVGKPSFGRFVLAGVVPFAALANVGINAAVGPAVFRPGSAVPLRGDLSIAGDTIVGAFLIGFFTLMFTAPAAEREVRAGRVRGVAAHVPWLAVATRRKVIAALLFGLAFAALVGGAAVASIDHLGLAPLGRGPFLLFKAGFAGAAGVLAAVVAAWIGAASVGPVVRDRRVCADPKADVDGPVYPFDYIDKGGLAVTSAAHGCSGTPTWQLVVRGALEERHVRAALADVVTRYPSLATKVQALDGAPPLATRFRYAHDPAFRLDAIFEVADLRDRPAEAEAVVREVENRPLDLFTDAPLSLTLVRTSDDGCLLLFRQHHAIADGRAFIGLLQDFARYLEAARAGQRPPADALAPVGRRGEVEALALPPSKRRIATVAGVLIVLQTMARSVLRPVTPLLQNRSNDYRGENGAVRWVVEDGILDGWNAARKAAGVSLGSLLTAAIFDANRRLHRALGAPFGRTRGTLVMETRPRDGTFHSFANHLATLEVEADLGRDSDLWALARSVQRQLERQRDRGTAVRRLLGERLLVRGMTLEQMQRLIFESKAPAYNFNFSNLIPLAFPKLEGDGWSVEEMRITTPVTPRTGTMLTVVRYGGRLFFNFNYKSSAFSRDQAEALCRSFREVLAEAVSGHGL